MKVSYIGLVFGLIACLHCSETVQTKVYSSFNQKIYCNPSSKILYPENTEEILKILGKANIEGKTVKAVGAQHSSTDTICTDGIPISIRRLRGAALSSDGNEATFGAGMELGAAMEFLERHNRMIPIVPAYSKITIGGAIGTGAHGSSLLHHATISDHVTAVTIITGNGTLLTVTSIEDVNHFKVHLGLLGILVNVTLKTLPLRKLTVHNQLRDEEVLFDGSALFLATKFDMFQVWWFPNAGEVVTSSGSFESVETPGNASCNFIFSEWRFGVSKTRAAFEFLQSTRNTHGLHAFGEFAKESLYREVVGKPPIFSNDGEILNNPATGFPWRLQASSCESSKTETCSWDNGHDSIYPEEYSLAFDVRDFHKVVKLIKKRFSENPFFMLLGFFIRFMKASTGTVSIATGRDTFTVGWLMPIRNNPFVFAHDQLGSSQALFQELVEKFGGRPHWGKNGLHYFTPEILKDTTPNRAKFVSAMKTFDPEGIFLNKFGKRILGVSGDMDKKPNIDRCAIQGYCICQKDSDCAPFQICSNLNGFRVCKDLSISKPARAHFNKFSNITDILDTVESQLYSYDESFLFRKTHSAFY